MIVFYARVSTTEQTTAHQRTQAEQAGFKIDKVVADEGISGVSTRLAERPEGKRLFDMLRSGDTLVVRWVSAIILVVVLQIMPKETAAAASAFALQAPKRFETVLRNANPT
jgi:hypothetical protein